MLVILTVLLVYTMRRAQQRKRRLLGTCSRQVATTGGVQNVAGTGSRRRRRSLKQLAEGNSTTLMLVTVVGVFLAVELPQAVTLILLIVQYTFELQIFDPDAGAIASLVCNLVILLSYPTNFFIYCAMSRAFRTTFAELFCGRRPPHNRLNTCDTPLPPPGRRFLMANMDEPAASKQFTDNDTDGKVILAMVDRPHEAAIFELREDENMTNI